MSKLYDVINRLEDLAEKEGLEASGDEIPYSVPKEPGKRRAPWLRVIMLSLVMILLGIGLVAFTAWWQDWFNLRPPIERNRAPETIAEPGPSMDLAGIPAVTATASTSRQTEFVRQARPSAETSGNLNPVPAGKNEEKQPVGEQRPLEPSETVVNQDLPVEVVTRPEIFLGHYGGAIDPVSSIMQMQPLPLDPDDFQVEKKVRENTFKLQQWLYQAEQLRKAEDWQAAILLYSRIWDISEKPEIANNLAASLMQVGRFEEARTILQSGLKLAPRDRDLNDNLETVQYLLERQ